MNIDAMCAAALVRLQATTDARIERFRADKSLYHFAIRSIAQQARRIREAFHREIRE